MPADGMAFTHQQQQQDAPFTYQNSSSSMLNAVDLRYTQLQQFHQQQQQQEGGQVDFVGQQQQQQQQHAQDLFSPGSMDWQSFLNDIAQQQQEPPSPAWQQQQPVQQHQQQTQQQQQQQQQQSHVGEPQAAELLVAEQLPPDAAAAAAEAAAMAAAAAAAAEQGTIAGTDLHSTAMNMQCASGAAVGASAAVPMTLEVSCGAVEGIYDVARWGKYQSWSKLFGRLMRGGGAGCLSRLPFQKVPEP
jgi:hypothetical protein